MSKLLCLLIGGILPFLTYSQTAILYGTITDGGLNEPLPFATISIKALGIGEISDLDGAYRLGNIPSGEFVVTFSYLGYENREFTLVFEPGQEIRQDVTLSEGGVTMQEVVVRGQATGQRAAIN